MKKEQSISTIKYAKDLIYKGIAEKAYDHIVAKEMPQRILNGLEVLEKEIKEMPEFETGAPNAECNDFVLTAINDYDCYQSILGGFSAYEISRNHDYLKSIDVNKLDFVWINKYLLEATEEERNESE